MLTFIIVTLLLAVPASGYTPDELQNMLNRGLKDIDKETIDGDVIVEQGSIPAWLSGNFIRHACGVFGHTDKRNQDLPNYISHLFDCFPMGQKFKLDNGNVTFTNRRYDTAVEDVYNYYDRNMNESSMFITGAIAKTNEARCKEWEQNMTESGKVEEVPAVTWWKLGDHVIAMSEMPVGVLVDTETMAQKGYIQYEDDNFNIPRNNPQYMLTNNPAHEHTDPDGTLWSMVTAVKFATESTLNTWRIVYKVGADRKREVVGEYHYQDSDLMKCGGGVTYPDMGARFGYMHSFSYTDNYVILPETGWLHDPCMYTRYDKYKGYFNQAFTYEASGFSRLLVMRKSDGVFVANITMPSFFVTHQFGSYEEGDLIHIDMITYDDPKIYTLYTQIDYVMDKTNSYTSNLTRITINMTDHSVTTRNLRQTDKPAAAFEMPNINYEYNGRKYTYGYVTRNFDLKEQNAILKINVDTGAELEYLFDEGIFVQEPVFVASPNSTKEDDGVILAQGFDGRQEKAFMVILDAKDMTLISQVTASDMALFGLHNRFYPTSGSAHLGSVCCLLVLFSALYSLWIKH